MPRLPSRCYGLRPERSVHRAHGIDDAGEILGACDGEDDDFDGELDRMIMVVDHAGRCAGCRACASVCSKTCQPHVAADKVAACWRINQENATMFAHHNCRLSARQKSRFDQHVLACVLSRALEEVEAGEATATGATGLSRAELRDVLPRGFPAVAVNAFALKEVSDPEPDMEEELLRGLLLAHARPDDPASTRFAKIIARRAMRDDHLWQDLGLSNRADLSRLLATHFPTLAAGNTQNMKWKRYFYRKLCEAEGFSLCTAPSCGECNDFENCFGLEEGESRLARIKNGIALD